MKFGIQVNIVRWAITVRKIWTKSEQEIDRKVKISRYSLFSVILIELLASTLILINDPIIQ